MTVYGQVARGPRVQRLFQISVSVGRSISVCLSCGGGAECGSAAARTALPIMCFWCRRRGRRWGEVWSCVCFMPEYVCVVHRMCCATASRDVVWALRQSERMHSGGVGWWKVVWASAVRFSQAESRASGPLWWGGVRTSVGVLGPTAHIEIPRADTGGRLGLVRASLQ